MITIHKYRIKMIELFRLNLPEGSEVIHVGVQHGIQQMWIRVDTAKPERETLFGVFGTGHDMGKVDEDGNSNPVLGSPHLGSFMLQGGDLVFHLFGGIMTTKLIERG